MCMILGMIHPIDKMNHTLAKTQIYTEILQLLLGPKTCIIYNNFEDITKFNFTLFYETTKYLSLPYKCSCIFTFITNVIA